jgi:hypothetical protein
MVVISAALGLTLIDFHQVEIVEVAVMFTVLISERFS